MSRITRSTIIEPIVQTRFHTKDKATADLFNHLLNMCKQKLDEKFIIECLDKGADITVTDNWMNNNSVITWVIANSSIDQIDQLLAILKNYYQQHPEIFKALINMPDNNGKSPLLLATMKGWQHKNTYKSFKRPMMQNAIKSLIRHGADIDAADHQGNTPLHIAVMRRDLEAVSYFLSCGADFSKLNGAGLKPIDMLKYNYEEACEIVRRKSKVFTMQKKTEFERSYNSINELFAFYHKVSVQENVTPNQETAAEVNPYLLRRKIDLLIAKMHVLFKNNVNKTITKDQVIVLLEQEQIPLSSTNIDESLDNLIAVVNKENTVATIFGYSNMLWDCICQFVKGLFGFDRESLINEACDNYKTSLYEGKASFLPQYNSQNSNLKFDDVKDTATRIRYLM